YHLLVSHLHLPDSASSHSTLSWTPLKVFSTLFPSTSNSHFRGFAFFESPGAGTPKSIISLNNDGILSRMPMNVLLMSCLFFPTTVHVANLRKSDEYVYSWQS
ncbi:hypothetical protein BGW80DRAFT_1513659, partial [Lactifluus volemus]